MLAACVCVAVALGPSVPPAGGPAVHERVGLIIIEGNVRTEDAAILRFLPGVYPGGRLPSETDRLRIELRLLTAFHRRFDLDAGLRPELVVLPNDNDSLFRDVKLVFPEMGPKPKKKRGG